MVETPFLLLSPEGALQLSHHPSPRWPSSCKGNPSACVTSAPVTRGTRRSSRKNPILAMGLMGVQSSGCRGENCSLVPDFSNCSHQDCFWEEPVFGWIELGGSHKQVPKNMKHLIPSKVRGFSSHICKRDSVHRPAAFMLRSMRSKNKEKSERDL